MDDTTFAFNSVFSAYGVKDQEKANNELTWEELHARRKELRIASSRLLDETKDAKWTTRHQMAYDYALDSIKALDREMDMRQASGDKGPHELGNLGSSITIGAIALKNCAEVWQDQAGNPVPVLAKEHKLADHGGHISGQGGYGVGTIMRALALGARNDREVKALSEGTGSAGGYTVPEHISRQIIDLARAKSHVINAGAMTVPLTTEKTSIARIASDPIPAWRLENADIAESDPTFDQVQFQARSLAVIVPVSRELLEDSINVESALQMVLAACIAGEADRVSLFGTGVAPEPEGLVNATGINTHDMGTDGAALASYAPILAAMQLMSDANAEMPTAAIMAPRTRYALSGLVDTTGQPLQRPDVVKDVPFMQTTKVPVDDTHGAASNASRIILGDFRNLFIGIRTGLRIEILKELYAKKHQYAFIAHMRMDVAVAQPGAFSVIEGIIPA